MTQSLAIAGGRRAAALLVFLLGGWAPVVSAETATSAPEARADADQTGWLTAAVGISVGDALGVDTRYYRPGFDPVPTLSIGWAWRLGAFDLGLSLEHTPGAHSSTYEGQPTRLGDQVAVLAAVRYRFVTEDWGGFYVSASPGLGIFMTTETLRGAIALAENVTPREVADLGIGVTLQSGLGFFTRLSETLQFVVEVSGITTLGTLTVADQSLPYQRYRARFHAGLAWRL
ncbi:MAG: hypothetical protein ACPGU1_00125 [Myxococcota bacterium]